MSSSPPTVAIRVKTPQASGRRTGWTKRIKHVDPNQRGGYAYQGEFLHDGQHELPAGAILLRVRPVGSVKNGTKEADVYQVREDGPGDLDGEEGFAPAITDDDGDAQRFNWFRDSVDLRKAVEQLLSGAEAATSPLAHISDDELMAECRLRGLI